jgi:hypothetical protein
MGWTPWLVMAGKATPDAINFLMQEPENLTFLE